MLRFVEITQKSLEYDNETESCKSLSFLREVYINPDYIISMRENASLKQEASNENLVEGIDKNLSFTELTVCASHRGAKVVNVVGGPTEIIEKYYRKRRK